MFQVSAEAEDPHEERRRCCTPDPAPLPPWCLHSHSSDHFRSDWRAHDIERLNLELVNAGSGTVISGLNTSGKPDAECLIPFHGEMLSRRNDGCVFPYRSPLRVCSSAIIDDHETFRLQV